MAKKKKTLSKLKKEAQIIFNQWIRERDKGMPCISSGKYVDLQAGHFFAVSTHQGLRYNEDNVHGESIYSNMFDQSHLIPYRDNLLKKIGQKRFDVLYAKAADYKQFGYTFTRAEVTEIIEKYKNKLK
ncbi:recombination protein NinG [bacterium]|nr:recombination protein NinG [bacterium]